MVNYRPFRAPIAGVFVLASLILSGTASAADRVALVIGNGKYQHAAELPNPPNDARLVAMTLSEIGFDVLQGIDLDRNSMEGHLRTFLDKANSAKIAVLFYAGHGIQVDGRNYLLPVDTKLATASNLNFGTIDLDRILASLDDPSRANIIILDACRDNPLARSFAAKTRSATVGAGLAAYSSVGAGTLIAFATAPGKVAADGGPGANSPFTQSLAKHLRAPDLEVRQMLTRVRADVAKATHDKQIPWDNSSLRGDVYLVDRAIRTEARNDDAATSARTGSGSSVVAQPASPWDGVWKGVWTRRNGRPRPFTISIVEGKLIIYELEGYRIPVTHSQISERVIRFGGTMRGSRTTYEIEILRPGSTTASVQFKSSNGITAATSISISSGLLNTNKDKPD
jgi:hypothetical protein